MKETINTTKEIIRLRLDEVIVNLTVPLIFFLIGHIILRLVLRFDTSDDLTSFELGTIMAMFVSLFTTAIIGTTNFKNNMAYAVSMGKCRKDVITAHIFHALLKSLILTIVIYLCHIYESYVCRSTYNYIPMEFDFNTLFKLEFFPLFVLAIASIEIFMGCLSTRFGQKIFWIIYASCIFCTSFFPTIINDTIEGRATGIIKTIGQLLITIFNNMTMNTLLVALCCTCTIFIASPYILLRKYRVAI